MPFRAWYYYCKLGVPVLFGTLALLFVLASLQLDLPDIMSAVLAMIFLVALWTLIGSGLLGGVMGLLLVFGVLRMTCPFCGAWSQVRGNSRDGMWLLCKRCGFVHGSGIWGLKL